MILEFEVQNYRSIKEKQVFSMVAESSKSKLDNVFEHTLGNGDTLRLLKTAVIYGANASGKSNLLNAFKTLRNLILSKRPVGTAIEFYNPFLFDNQTKNTATSFVLTFIGPNNFKYRYEVFYNKKEILKETLDYYPKTQSNNLYKRPVNESKTTNENYNLAKVNHKTFKIFKNQLFLSKFGFDEPHDIMTAIFQYFNNDNFSILNPYLRKDLSRFRKLAEKVLIKNREFIPVISSIMQVADTKIDKIDIREKAKKWLLQTNDREVVTHIQERSYETFAEHAIYENKKKIASSFLSFEEESEGSIILFALSTYILFKLKYGGVFMIDEIDTSFHPKLAKFLIQLFQNKKSNPKNTQIIFTTHETAFLDKDLFRKDQIWFTEKNDYGETELFSIQDFDNVREDTPFDKWYMAGKFGGVPDIKELEAIFLNGTTE